jgi:putative peptidoglycan lipid II flippase
MAAGYTAHHLIQFIDRAMSTSLGEGGAAVLNYGYHIALAVGQLSGLAVSTVMFPGLSEQVGFQELDRARRSINQALELVWGLALPASLGLVLLRTQVVQVLLEHGAFRQQATQDVGTVMAIYAFAMLADALCQPLWRVVYTQRSGKVVLWINGIQTFVRIAANLLLIRQLGYYGLAISAVIGLITQIILLMILAWKSIGWRLSGQSFVVGGKIFVAGSVAYIATLVIKSWLGNSIQGFSPILILLASGISLLIIYTALLIGVFKIYPKTEATTYV